MVDYGRTIWIDGKLADWNAGGSISLLTHTLHYGVGAFEGIRAYKRAGGDTAIFRLREHIVRLFDSCRLVMLQPKVDIDQVCQACSDVLRANNMDEAYLRPLVLLAEGDMGLLPKNNPVTTLVIAWKWGTYLGSDALEKGIRCKISSYARHHINIAFTRGKVIGQYVNSVMAKREATLAGYDEAILLDVHGAVAEGSGENIFLVKDGRVATPPLSSSILPGITRDTVLTLCREEGLPLAERSFNRDELYLADEVFLTGTAAEITPVREIDNRVIGAGRVGPITERLQKRYFDIVRGSDDSHPEWLTRL